MTGDYPRFRTAYSHDALVEYFLLTPTEQDLIAQCRGDVNRHGVAVLLKSLHYLGYFPESPQDVPPDVRTFLARQLHLLWDPSAQYPTDDRTQRSHLAWMRQHTGWRASTADDKAAFASWLRDNSAPAAPTEEDLLEGAYQRLRALQIALPTERALRRVVHTAFHEFFHDISTRVTARLPETVRTQLDALLVVGADESVSPFEQLKTTPAAPGIAPLQQEMHKLQTLRTVGVPAEALADVPEKVVTLLQRRAHNERAGEMRAHPAPIRYALMACFLQVRTMEGTDDVVRMLFELIRRMETQTEQHLQKTLLRDIKRVTGKIQLRYRVAEAVMEEPDGTIRTVLVPQVQEETFRELAAEAKASGPQYRIWYPDVLRQKYLHHYRQMLPWILEPLTFRSENRFQPVIEALAVIKQSLGTKGPYCSEEETIPLDGVVIPSWRDTVIEKHDGNVQINRQYYELCGLQPLERALKCTEVWVEGAYALRNPSQDRPADWPHEAQRATSYQGLPQPVQVASFIDPLREQLTHALTQLNHALPQNPHVHLSTAAANEDRRLFAVDRLTARPEPQRLAQIKNLSSQRYGMVDLLDIFVEADRLTGFTQFFPHSGTKEVRSRDALRPLLLLDVFAEGPNTGITRVATANQRYPYDALLYVRKQYVSVEALRQANATVVNQILALRDPRLWGEGHACASDGTRVARWRQHLMTEWRSRYKGYGVLVYWHVETNAVALYSQLHNFSLSAVAAMIEGLIRHDTAMRVEKNCVDSHGPSEVALAFCHL
jgi:Tn3 transposase DDE domain-containing protein/uncharacterized protein DUF4158